ncbi:SCY1-like protein 2 [Chrysoperla carnea]|uniref:SCY1-like protein 2 n=1 Tax=Chrysoperla carnea TaxID=189513 RepID=UPI001D087BB2|nr:SCY1-like protein 2 [Chrysoperla carnea]
MDVFNKLYSSVSSTVSHLSGVLPGNPVTREYEVISHIASAGPGLLWKIYKGFKKSTKQEAAIFVLEKRHLERWTKADRDIMIDILRRGVMQLTKLRHPQILTVQHPLEESRESLAFATEPVFASLANILGNIENMPVPVPESINNYKLYEVEIKYGLLQVGEGLAFLHNDVKLLHKNICPESIVINIQGAWKIFGFDFCILNQNIHESQPFWPFTEYTQAMHALTQPTLDYLAPECALTHVHSTASDMFSLGMLVYALHSPGGRPLFQYTGDYSKFKRTAKELKQLPNSKLLCVAEGLQEYVKMMLNTTPELRPDAHQFIKIPYFEDVGVKTLNYLDSLFQWDNLQKSQFYKGLPQIIQKLPHRVCIYRIIPCLVKEFVNPPMIPFVLPNVLLIAENATKDEYIQHILPHLKPVMKIQEPIQILLIFMQKMELLLKLTPAEEIKTDVLPMLYRALEADAQQIQELCLSVLPTYASLVDYPAMKNALLPRIKRLCLSTSYLSVRVNCLLCIGKLLEHLDKWLVLDEILPFLTQIPSREPAVLMGILGIYKLAMTHKKLGITKECIATKILPFLMPLCIENGLTLNQFNALVTLVKEMVNQVESEHRTKLEQLNSIQKEQKTFDASLSTGTLSPGTLVQAPQPQSAVDEMFSGLGLDSYINDSPKHANALKNENTGSSSTSMDTIPNGVDNKSLSMADKQRIAKQQETSARLKNQPILSPTSTNTPKITPPTKDLTSSLIQSNLSQMNLMTSPKSPPPMNNTPNSNQMWAQSPPQQQWTNSQNSAPNTWMSSPPLQNRNNNFNSQFQQNTMWNNSTSQQQQPQQNWSALDSLLSNNSTASSKPTLNQMTSQRTPLMQSPTSTNNTVLSKDDIMDLLS